MALHSGDEIVNFLTHSEVGKSGAVDGTKTATRSSAPPASSRTPTLGSTKEPARRRTREERLLLALVRLLASQRR